MTKKERKAISNAKYRAKPGAKARAVEYMAAYRADPATAKRLAEYNAEYGAEYHSKEQNKSRATERARFRKYGLTPTEYNFKLAGQGFCCDLCGAAEPGTIRGWQTDHCHATNRVRGILCMACNHGLGRVGDTPEALLRAYLYTIGEFNWTQTERMDWTPLTSETDGRPKRSLPIEQNESRHTNWSAGLL